MALNREDQYHADKSNVRSNSDKNLELFTKNEILVQSNVELETKNKQLINELTTLNEELTSYEEQVNNLQTDNTRLRENKAQLTEEFRILKERSQEPVFQVRRRSSVTLHMPVPNIMISQKTHCKHKHTLDDAETTKIVSKSLDMPKTGQQSS